MTRARDVANIDGLLTTTGDTYYASAAGTPARLGIGTVGQVLTVNSGATAPEWATASAGGMTLIATATPSAAASFNFTSIPSTYKHLLMVWRNFESTTGGSASAYGLVTVNNNTAANYNFRCITATSGTLSHQYGSSLTSMMGTVDIGSQAFPAMYGIGYNLPQTGSQGEMWLWNYASTSTSGRIFSYKSTGTNQSSTNYYSANGFAGTTVNTAISRIDVTASASTFSGICYLYGVS